MGSEQNLDLGDDEAVAFVENLGSISTKERGYLNNMVIGETPIKVRRIWALRATCEPIERNT